MQQSFNADMGASRNFLEATVKSADWNTSLDIFRLYEFGICQKSSERHAYNIK